jgi:hypothetical protein
LRQGTALAVPKGRNTIVIPNPFRGEGPASNAVRSESCHVREPHGGNVCHPEASLQVTALAVTDLLFTPPKPGSLAKKISKTPAVRQGTSSAAEAKKKERIKIRSLENPSRLKLSRQ